ncbi:hypothetical protein K435DRAFT_806901 [Dendrothele bispora CBS 962.96]|uniref:Uncharacterized protein n=1 Tax=Dendrothele bispora (strain CBS 962.96) TaxID=1314807 RepID=A0A4S8L6U2_DENBC|nr:hypothetical protein K435DRAFT_806901 [Dendrothele bispora CBS 962.96]
MSGGRSLFPQDTLLNEAGKAQTKQVAEALADVEFSLVYSSDLKRASETAETIIRYHDGVKFVKTKELQERSSGLLGVGDAPLAGVRIGQLRKPALHLRYTCRKVFEPFHCRNFC